MRKILRNFLLNFFCFWLISNLVPAIDYSNRIEILALASLVLSLINLLVKPVLNILFLPINLITLGTFRWIINVIVLFLVTQVVLEFKIKPFIFSGLNFYGFVVPKIYFSHFWSYVLVAFLLSIITDILNTILK